MPRLSSALLALSILAVLGSSASGTAVETRQDDDGDGITTVADVQNPKCAPWYEIRDVIMGDIFKGKSRAKNFFYRSIYVH